MSRRSDLPFWRRLEAVHAAASDALWRAATRERDPFVVAELKRMSAEERARADGYQRCAAAEGGRSQ